MPSLDKFNGTTQEKSLQLREFFGGVLETELTEETTKKPVAIISDGSAVLGFGNIGAEAGLPVMEGKAVLFKALGDVNAMPLCIKTQIPEEIVKLVLLLEDSFSGVNLEDISAPRCFEIEDSLKEKSKIVIFHDDQHGTAIVVLAALLNAIHLVQKKIEDVKIVFSGAGAAAQAVCKLFLKAGFKNIILNDINGAVYAGRKQNDKSLEEISKYTNLEQIKGTLKDTIKNADVFVGLSAPNVLTSDMIQTMADKPIIFALANPTPEINPQLAKESGAFIVATGRSDFENQVNNSLAFPGLFRGVLEGNLSKITDEMKLECAFSIASLVSDDELSPTMIIPHPLDCRVPSVIAENINS
ncbi:NADP-dependent malic enzyme [bacterium]|nr:NADP-dependent malic enzyme [bacterium]